MIAALVTEMLLIAVAMFVVLALLRLWPDWRVASVEGVDRAIRRVTGTTRKGCRNE